MMTQNKIALVTGGSRGLGRDIAINIAKKGLDVILTYNSKKEEADAVVKTIESLGGKAAAIQLNVADTGSFDRFIKDAAKTLTETFNAQKFGFLINNAGIGVYASIVETTESQLDTLFNIHLKGPFFLTQKILPMLADGGGIVNVSTGLARFTLDGHAAYAAMKGAVEILTRYQARELGSRKIRANVIAPGAIETDFGEGAVRDNAALNQHISSTIALGRVGLPDDIGSVAAFLCTDEAKWVNGQRIEISGGQNL